MGGGFVALMFLLVSLIIVLGTLFPTIEENVFGLVTIADIFFLVDFGFSSEGFVWVEARTALKPSSSTNFTIENKCDYPVWPVINGTATEFSISTTCFALKKGEARLISVCPATTPNNTRLVGDHMFGSRIMLVPLVLG